MLTVAEAEIGSCSDRTMEDGSYRFAMIGHSIALVRSEFVVLKFFSERDSDKNFQS